MEKEKKNNFSKLIAMILILCSICCFIAYGYLEFNMKDNDALDKTENNIVEEDSEDISTIDVSSDVVQNNFNKFMNMVGNNCGDEAAFYFTSNKVSVTDVDNMTAFKTVMVELDNDNGSISADVLSEKIKEYYGVDYNFQHQTYELCVNHRYNPETNLYEYFKPNGCGCTSGWFSAIKYKVATAKVDGDLLILNVKVLFPDKEHSATEYHKYYSDVERTKVITDLSYEEVFDDYYGGAKLLEEDSNYAKGGDYKFVMKKVTDDIYSFVSSEPIA